MLYVNFTSIYKKPNHLHLLICASCDYTPIKIVKILPQALLWFAKLEMVHLPVNSHYLLQLASYSGVTPEFEKQIICYIGSSPKENLKTISELRKMHNKVLLSN